MEDCAAQLYLIRRSFPAHIAKVADVEFATLGLYGAAIGVSLLAVGLAIFNAGMVRSKHTLGMAMFGFAAIAVTAVTWTLVGFSLAAGEGSGWSGGFAYVGLAGLDNVTVGAGVEADAAAFFLMAVVAASSVALVGTAADRMRFGPMLAFLVMWTIAVPPLVLRSTMLDGPLAQWGVVDGGGGLLLGVAVGASALGLALVLSPRNKWRKRRVVPHNRPQAFAGVLVAWAGWLALALGFALLQGGNLSVVIVAHLGAVGGAGGWALLDKRLHGKVSSVGAIMGALTGLAAVTPGLGSFGPLPATVVGFLAGAAAALAVRIKYRLHFDDALDVFAVYFFGGAIGALMVGVLADGVANPGIAGLITGDGGALLLRQAGAVGLVALYAFVATVVIAWVVRAAMGLRVSPEDESRGLDHAQHGETAYRIRR